MWASRYLKTTFITWILLISVIGFYVSLFLLKEWLGSGIRLVAVFCILPYAIIYFHDEWKYGIWVLAVASIGLWFYLGWNTYLVLWFIAALVWFYKTADTIHEDVHNKIKVSDFDVFTGESVSTFVTYMTMAYVFTFISFNPVFNLNCEELYQYSNKALNIALLRDSTIKYYINWFFITSIQPFIAVQAATNQKAIITDSNNTQKQIPSPKTRTAIQQDPGAKYRVVTESNSSTKLNQWWSVIDTIQAHQAANTINSSWWTIISLAKLEAIREKLLKDTVDQSNSIEEWVCTILFKEIRDKYTNPNFKISVIFMMYTVMRPAIEMVLHLISYVNWSIFRMMFKIGWFKKYEDWEVAENLE